MTQVIKNTGIQTLEKFSTAFKEKDGAKIKQLYHDDVRIWHGSTRQSQDREDNVAFLSNVFDLANNIEYINIKRHAIDGGAVQQHTLVGTFKDGTEMPSLEACLVVKVNQEGLITEIDEYFDASQFGEVWKRLA
ncbi:nuclear transport factor 2 family protein [Epilithonimonas hungarica]|uniref:Limonene-1,2-epoxide hydrolase n=1 Tax=Epilithonimonas hungarica TaxID=454006 RepID=A0A1G7SD11_9FLAO|nr:nuclear transport factor 2 family protein [Epilithonimonas hungarica]SDG20090.1 Limonene-1,2-epoxide hydrolase [Epilithonimonas hungarica]